MISVDDIMYNGGFDVDVAFIIVIIIGYYIKRIYAHTRIYIRIYVRLVSVVLGGIPTGSVRSDCFTTKTCNVVCKNVERLNFHLYEIGEFIELG